MAFNNKNIKVISLKSTLGWNFKKDLNLIGTILDPVGTLNKFFKSKMIFKFISNYLIWLNYIDLKIYKLIYHKKCERNKRLNRFLKKKHFCFQELKSLIIWY